jgi:hypothetical protein
LTVRSHDEAREFGRRDDDYTEPGRPRRREDDLEELLEHGSRNFRRYRRRAMTRVRGTGRGDRDRYLHRRR